MEKVQEHVRTETICRGCGEAKGTGLLVCWTCFKYREDIVPFKYFRGTLTEWLEAIGAPILQDLPELAPLPSLEGSPEFADGHVEVGR